MFNFGGQSLFVWHLYYAVQCELQHFSSLNLVYTRLCNLHCRRNTVCSSTDSPKALHVTYRGPWVTSTRVYLYSLVMPTNTKQNMSLYHSVSLTRWLCSSLSGYFPNWKSWVRIRVKIWKFLKLANKRYTKRSAVVVQWAFCTLKIE